MAPVTVNQINDYVHSTLDDYGPPSFRQIAQRLTRYEIFSRWFKEDKVRIQSGLGVNRRLMTDHDTDNLHTGPYSEDAYNFRDVLTHLRVEFVYVKKPWGFNYSSLLHNRGEALITNVVEPERANCMLNIAHDIEDKGWSSPASSSDTSVPYGVPYWVVKGTEGFNGGLPSGHSTVAGIDITEHDNFKNYCNEYADVTEDDLLFKMHDAKLATYFYSLAEVGGENEYIESSFRCYTNKATWLRLNKLARARNDNYGLDLSYGEGGTAYGGNKIVYVPKLDEDTDDPVYMLYHDVFCPYVMEDNFLRESEVIRTDYNHDIYVVWMDLAYNYVCEDRRRQTVISK